MRWGLRAFQVERVPLVALWIHENPLYNIFFVFGNLVRRIQLRHQFPGARMNLLFARHGRVHKSFQFSPRVFVGIPCILRDPDQWSGFLSVVEHWRVLASRFATLVFSILGDFPNFAPYFRPYMIWSRSRLNSCQYLLRPHYPLEVLLSIEWILWILSKNLTNFCSNRHSNTHQYAFYSLKIISPFSSNRYEWILCMIQFSTSPTFRWFISSVLRLSRWHLEVLLPLEDRFRCLAFCQQMKQNSAPVSWSWKNLGPLSYRLWHLYSQFRPHPVSWSWKTHFQRVAFE